MFEKINSHNEWDKIKEIIVGTGKNTTATLTWKRDQEIDQKKLDQATKLAKEACPQWLYDEIEEDLDGLANTLKDLGKLLRTISIPFTNNSSTLIPS